MNVRRKDNVRKYQHRSWTVIMHTKFKYIFANRYIL